jgi:hypothetical protein
MKLVTKIENSVIEEAPGYFTVYGDDGRSVGVLVATQQDDVYWLYGDAHCSEIQGELKELCTEYGMPYTAPTRLELVPLEAYEPDAKKLERVAKAKAMLDSLIATIDAELAVLDVKKV